MIYLIATVCGLMGGAALGFGWGLLAATLYSNMGGPRDGGPAMAGFFYVGPFGLVSGFLLTAGFILKMNLGESMLNRSAIWGGVGVLGLGMLVFLLPWMPTNSRPQSKYVLTMQYEVPAGSDVARYQWGYQGHSEKGEAGYPFHQMQSEATTLLLSGDMEMSDVPPRRIAFFAQDKQEQKFEIPLAGPVTAATEWSPWTEGVGVRFRWRIR